MATISDVARLAGVATSTVSHVLNGTRFVSPDTARAVNEAVRAVGYTPNTLARALARSTTNTVGLAVSPTKNRYFADVINAIEEECSRLGMMVLLANTHDNPTREAEVVAALHQRRVDGIIVAPSDPSGPALGYLHEKRIPAVMVDRLPDAGLDGVGVENIQALAQMVDHLVGHGHARIGFLGGQATFTTAQERATGFREALARHRLEVDETLIAVGHTELGQASAAARRMLARHDAPTAIIGANNLCTIGVMLAAREMGLHVPGELAVIGFDDFDWADSFDPRLTVMAQPCQEIGQTAAMMLKRRIDGSALPPVQVRLKPTLMVRRSCGCDPDEAEQHPRSRQAVVVEP